MIKYFLSIIQSKFGINDKTIITNYLKLSVGIGVTSLIALISTNYINRYLSPKELGVFSYNKSLLELFFGVVSLNIYSSYLRFNLKGDNIHLKKTVRKVITVSSFIICFFIFYLTKSIFSLLFLFIIAYTERMYYFRSLLQIRQLNSIQIIAALTTLSSIIINKYVNIYPIDSNTIIGSYGLGYFLGVLLIRSQPAVIDEELVPIKSILFLCLPTVGLVILDWILNFSSVVYIKEFFDYTELAKYAIAQRALIFIKLISGTFLMFYPMIYFRAIENREKVKVYNSRKLILAILLLMLVVFIFAAKYIYIILGAESYLSSNSIIIYKILLVAEFIRVASSLVGLYLTFSLKTITSLFILATGGFVNLTLQFLFLKKYGIVFSSISTLISSLIILFLMFWYSYKKEKLFLNEKIVN